VIDVQNEQNIDIIRQYAVLLEGEIQLLKKKLDGANLKRPDQQWLSSLEDQLSRLKQKVFVGGREKLKKQDRPVGHGQQELKLHGERAQDEKKDNTGENSFQNSSEMVTHEYSKSLLEFEAKLRGIKRGVKAFEKLPIFQESREITVIERTYKEVVHRRRKYRLKPRYNVNRQSAPSCVNVQQTQRECRVRGPDVDQPLRI